MQSATAHPANGASRSCLSKRPRAGVLFSGPFAGRATPGDVRGREGDLLLVMDARDELESDPHVVHFRASGWAAPSATGNSAAAFPRE
jgi:hypothetical protein